MSGGRTDPVEDARLVREVVAGSEGALAELYDRHAGAVYAAALRLTSDRQLAEDIVQEAFLTVWNRAEQFNPDAGSLAAWLLTIARNRTVDHLRSAGRRPAIVSISATRQDDEADDAAFERIAHGGTVVGAGSGLDPVTEVAAGELRETLRDALSVMPEPEREVLLLAYREELSQIEISTRLGIPLGTVKTRTRRGLLRMRTVLGPDLAPVPLAGADDGQAVTAAAGSGMGHAPAWNVTGATPANGGPVSVNGRAVVAGESDRPPAGGATAAGNPAGGSALPPAGGSVSASEADR